MAGRHALPPVTNLDRWLLKLNSARSVYKRYFDNELVQVIGKAVVQSSLVSASMGGLYLYSGVASEHVGDVKPIATMQPVPDIATLTIDKNAALIDTPFDPTQKPLAVVPERITIDAVLAQPYISANGDYYGFLAASMENEPGFHVPGNERDTDGYVWVEVGQVSLGDNPHNPRIGVL